MRGFLNHLWITIKLNFRNKQALVFGYVVPIFFLFAFGSLFGAKSAKQPLLRELSQVLTISMMGGACFGMPVTLVTERERGVWRRYKLVPLATGWFVASTMFARYLIVLTSALLQLAVAMAVYKTPLPEHPFQLLVAFTVASYAFMSIGLVIGVVANSAGSVQAMGQSLFLPMIIIGGVGVPLATLPVWARHVAAFLPGRYAVEAMTKCCLDGRKPPYGLEAAWFQIAALLVIGTAAVVAGAKLFRWEAEQRYARGAKWWALLALASWAAVGIAAEMLNMVYSIT